MNRGPWIFLGTLAALSASFYGLVLRPQMDLGRLVESKAMGSDDLYPVARPGTAAHRVELVTGLGVADAAALAESQAALRRRLLDFADGFAPVGARTWATYGGGDAAWLGEPTVDVLHRMFRPWRERVGGESAAASLELAATLSASIPGDSPLKPRSGCVFAPHVAFEDAIATAAVLAATLRTDGEL